MIKTELDGDSFVEYHDSFFDQPTADELLKHFLKIDFPWQRQAIRGVLTRRSNAWFANDPRLVYRYSGQTWTPTPLTLELTEIRDCLTEACPCSFNSVLAALYPDGQAAVSWHDDNDFPTLPDSPIVTVSFGSQRRFKIRRKSDQEIVAEYDVTHGSMIVMGGAIQRHYDHALQKTSKKVAPRVNLSYRVFHAPN